MTAADALIDLIAGDAPVVRHGADEEMPEHLVHAALEIGMEEHRKANPRTYLPSRPDCPACLQERVDRGRRAEALRDALAAIPDHVAAEMSPDALVSQGIRIATWILEES